ncbi:hypothetical protein pEaSNUABM11_00174 [Erwinia phage pEa_SNUABM_11]|nr:hypothetical protein pEaSNUABM11_00174 [Erwinia phage pEa_SNUABM_11]
MGIKLQWDSQADQNLDGIEIYRSASPISTTAPGTPLITLAGTATAYEDNTVVNKSIYYYRIAGKKGTERAWGENISSGYFSETGPGRTYPIRGDWNGGMFDYLDIADFITPADLLAKVPALGNYGTRGSFTTWYKMAYKGKVLFIPNTYVVTATQAELYKMGVLFGTDDFGTIPTGTPSPGVNQRTKVNINGLDYILRCPRLSNVPLTQYLTAQDDTIASEWRSTGSRLSRATLESDNGMLPRLWDNTNSMAVIGPHLNTTSLVGAHAAGAPGTLVGLNTGTRYAALLLLELVMP